MIYRVLLIFLIAFCAKIFSQEIDRDLLKKIDPELLKTLSSEQLEELSNFDIDDEDKGDFDSLEKSESKATILDQKNSLKFGHNFVNNLPISSTIEPNLPLTNDYRISLGDELKVILSGSKKDIIDLKVELDGAIFFPDIGAISVVGETFEQVKQKLTNIVDNSFVGTRVDISFNKLSLKKISIIGAVENPGVYLVNPFTTVSSSMAYAGGLEDFASLRNIEIISFQGEKTIFDLYDFLIFGDRSKDYVINSGDTVVVKATDSFVRITGEVLRPMEYEYLADDKFSDLIDFSMGFSSNADQRNLYIQEVVENSLISTSIDLNAEIGNRKITEIEITKKLVSNNKDIKVVGNAVSSGFFDKNKFKTLPELLSKLEFSSEIYPFYFTLQQSSKSGLKKEKKYFSLADPETYKNVVLQNNVEIMFFDRNNIRNKKRRIENMLDDLEPTGTELKDLNDYLVSELNSIFPTDERKKQIRESNILLKEYIRDVSKKNSSTIIDYKEALILENEVPDLHMKLLTLAEETFEIPVVGKFRPQQLLDFFNEGSLVNIDQVKVFTLDGLVDGAFLNEFESSEVLQITFPEEYIDSFVVTISGQVKYPGSYTVSSKTTLDDLYGIVGGISENASNSGIFFSRETVKEKERKAFDAAKKVLLDSVLSNVSNPSNDSSVNFTEVASLLEFVGDVEVSGRISGNLSPDSMLARSLLLEKGDSIFVPASSRTVSIIGEVLNPITLPLDEDFDIYDYVEAAGSFTEFSDKNNMYVIRSNGTSIPIDNSFFSAQYYLEPGDTLVIPRDLDKLKALPLISVATKIISDIAFAAASLNAIQN